MINDKIRIRIKKYQHRVDEKSNAEIKGPLARRGAHVVGAIPLPTVKNKWTVLRSHVDKKSREQFEIRTHKRLMEILDPAAHTVELVVEDPKVEEMAKPYFEKIGESRKRARRVQSDINRVKRKTKTLMEKLP